MKDSVYLVFGDKGIKRMLKGKQRGRTIPPRLGIGEYAVQITVTVPAAAFKPRPIPTASVTVPESAVIQPPVEVEMGMVAGSVELT